MPLQHLCTKRIMQALIAIQQEVTALHNQVEASMRRSELRTIIAAGATMTIDVDINDQLPPFMRDSNFRGGNVVALDFCTGKVTVDVGAYNDLRAEVTVGI